MISSQEMREWLSGGVSPCQGEGRGFESRLALNKKEDGYVVTIFFFVESAVFEHGISAYGKWESEKPCSNDLGLTEVSPGSDPPVSHVFEEPSNKKDSLAKAVFFVGSPVGQTGMRIRIQKG